MSVVRGDLRKFGPRPEGRTAGLSPEGHVPIDYGVSPPDEDPLAERARDLVRRDEDIGLDCCCRE